MAKVISSLQRRSLASWLFAFLCYLLAVVLFGTVVRATHSGAGCGNHWPLCKGEWIPDGSSLKTWIEYTHRVTSGLTLPIALFLYLRARRVFAAYHPCRKALTGVLLFLVSEALLGAGIVWLEHVADNRSSGRGFTMSLHLVNTFLLMACAVWSWLAAREWSGRTAEIRGTLPILGAVGILFVGVSGAITALGDTLFPPLSAGEVFSLAQDATSHLFLRLRVYHPFFALCLTGYLVLLTWHVAEKDPTRTKLYIGFGSLLGVQILAGYFNIHLLAPLWMQVVHLGLAQCVWMSYVGIFLYRNCFFVEPTA